MTFLKVLRWCWRLTLRLSWKQRGWTVGVLLGALVVWWLATPLPSDRHYVGSPNVVAKGSGKTAPNTTVTTEELHGWTYQCRTSRSKKKGDVTTCHMVKGGFVGGESDSTPVHEQEVWNGWLYDCRSTWSKKKGVVTVCHMVKGGKS